MTDEEAKAIVDAAMSRVNPQWRGRRRSPSGVGVKIIRRGDVFDVALAHPGRLYAEYAAAIQDDLGGNLGKVWLA